MGELVSQDQELYKKKKGRKGGQRNLFSVTVGGQKSWPIVFKQKEKRLCHSWNIVNAASSAEIKIPRKEGILVGQAR